MKLNQLKNKLLYTLKSIYPKDEITSIFRMLVQNQLGLNPAEIVLEGNKELQQKEIDYFLNRLVRLQNKEPIQYVLGICAFYNLDFKVTSDVLIPRPETEELVKWIINDAEKLEKNKKLCILDIGTGSGCIAVSLAKNLINTQVSALDISKNALEIAKENAKINKVDIQFIQVDILNTKHLPQTYDIILSNPPYVREQEKLQMHDNVLKHEPNEALFVQDENPLLFYDKICSLAKKHLAVNGSLYFEINQYMGKEMQQLLNSKGFSSIELRKDFLGKDRMIKARL